VDFAAAGLRAGCELLTSCIEVWIRTALAVAGLAIGVLVVGGLVELSEARLIVNVLEVFVAQLCVGGLGVIVFVIVLVKSEARLVVFQTSGVRLCLQGGKVAREEGALERLSAIAAIVETFLLRLDRVVGVLHRFGAIVAVTESCGLQLARVVGVVGCDCSM